MNTATNYETELKPEVVYLGSLEDLGLGNPDGIPSKLADKSDEERVQYGERLAQAIAEVTDFKHYACIDGRNCVCNADGSKPEVRNRQVGGTGLLIEVALNGGAPIIDTIKETKGSDVTLAELVEGVEDDYTMRAEVRRSAHLGGCGGVKGAVADNKNINENEAPVNVAGAIMQLPAVREYTGYDFDPDLGGRVRIQAGITAQWLEDQGWDGDTYVAKAKTHEPAGVEDLTVNPTDQKFHGHAEDAVILFLSKDGTLTISEQKMKEHGLGEAFVVNVNTSVDMAKVFAGDRGEEAVVQLITANLTKHSAVADRLASRKTPVYFMAT